MINVDINALAQEIYTNNKERGWWDNPNRCLYECLQLASTEVAEATEGERKSLNDDHLPHRKMGEVELADCLIRVLDLMGHMGVTVDIQRIIDSNVATESVFQIKNWSIGRRHLLINQCICDVATKIEFKTDSESEFAALIGAIYCVAETCNYDLEAAMREKLEYNKTRADHSREARASDNGKKF